MVPFRLHVPPRASADASHSPGRPAGDGDLPELALSEVAHEHAVWRPERKRRVLGPGDHLRDLAVQRTDPQRRPPARLRGNENETPAIRRERELGARNRCAGGGERGIGGREHLELDRPARLGRAPPPTNGGQRDGGEDGQNGARRRGEPWNPRASARPRTGSDGPRRSSSQRVADITKTVFRVLLQARSSSVRTCGGVSAGSAFQSGSPITAAIASSTRSRPRRRSAGRRASRRGRSRRPRYPHACRQASLCLLGRHVGCGSENRPAHRHGGRAGNRRRCESIRRSQFQIPDP